MVDMALNFKSGNKLRSLTVSQAEVLFLLSHGADMTSVLLINLLFPRRKQTVIGSIKPANDKRQ